MTQLAHDTLQLPPIHRDDMGLNLDDELEEAVIGDMNHTHENHDRSLSVSSNRVATVKSTPSRNRRGVSRIETVPHSFDEVNQAHTQVQTQKAQAQTQMGQLKPLSANTWDGFTQLRELQEQNGKLLLDLDRKSKDLKRLQQQLEERTSNKSMENIISETFSSDTVEGLKDQKIMDLARKARRLYVSLEKEKSKTSILQLETMDRIKQPVVKSAPPKSEKDDTRVLKEKLAQCLSKLESERIQNQGLKGDIRNLKRILVQEVGEGVSIEKLSDDKSGWKGRAQQIASKIQSLKSQLAKAMTTSNQNLEDGGNDTESCFSNTLSTFDSRNREIIKQRERERRQMLENALKESSALHDELEVTKRKSDAIQARNKVLEKQVADLKEKLREVIQKSEIDDRLITELKKELKKAIKSSKKAESCDKCHEKDRRLKDQQTVIEKLQRGISPDSKADANLLLQLEISETENRQLRDMLKASEGRFKYLTSRSSTPDNSSPPLKLNPDESHEQALRRLRSKIDIQCDEIKVLKATLRSTVEDKERELDRFHTAMEDLKRRARVNS